MRALPESCLHVRFDVFQVRTIVSPKDVIPAWDLKPEGEVKSWIVSRVLRARVQSKAKMSTVLLDKSAVQAGHLRIGT